MSWKASAYVKALVVCPNGERISRTEKLVALVLADSHQDKGKAHTYPAVKTIAEDSLMDPRVCRRMLASLERKGVIARERAENQGRGQLTFYRFPALDGAKEEVEEGGPNVLLFSGGRRTEGGRKEDKTPTPPIGRTETETNASTTPPTPSLRDGEDVPRGGSAVSIDDAEIAQIAQARDQVCDAIGVAQRRRRAMLRDVIEQRARLGESPPEIAALMIRRWQRQAEYGKFLRVRLGLLKFFGDGYWLDENRWFWDEEKWRLHCEAKVGSVG